MEVQNFTPLSKLQYLLLVNVKYKKQLMVAWAEVVALEQLNFCKAHRELQLNCFTKS